MAKLKLYETIASKLSSLTKNNGNLIVTRDTKTLHIDLNGQRIEITDFIDVDTEQNLLATLTPLSNKYYYALDTSKLYRYVNGSWKCLNKDDIIKTIKINGVEQTNTNGVINLPAYPTSLPASNTTDTYSSTGTSPVSGKAVASALGTLDSSISATDGYAITGITETDGKLTAKTEAKIPDKVSELDNDEGYIGKNGGIVNGDITADGINTGSLIVRGSSRFIGNTYGDLKGNADTATALSSGTDKTKLDSAVQSVKISGSNTEYKSGTNVTLPAYPTTLPASDVASWAKAANKPSYTASEVGALANTVTHLSGDIATSEKGAANGVATLGTDGKIPSSQLPSYVDDVLEYSAKTSFPTTGESGKIYVNTADNKTYRWSGSAYVEISPSIVVGTTTGTAMDGKSGKDHVDNTTVHITAAERTAWNAKTSNIGTITGINMNGVSKGTSGVVDLGTVITSHQDISGKQDVITSSNKLAYSLISGTPTSLPANGGNADMAKLLQTYKQNSTTETYGTSYPVYAQWRDNTHVKFKCTGYTTEIDYADNAGNATKATQDASGNVITSTYATKTELSDKLDKFTNGGIASCVGEGTYLYCKICTINIKKTYINSPVVFELSGRGRMFSRITIRFQNIDSTDPALTNFYSDFDNCYYIKKTATSTWELYTSYSEKWGSCFLHRIVGAGADDIGITVNMINVSSLPSDYTSVTYGGNVNYANSAGAVAWENVSGKPYSSFGNASQQDASATAGSKSTCAMTDINGYIHLNYINSNTVNNENPTISQIIVTNGVDNYYRKASLAHLKSALGSMPASDVYAWAKASSKPSYTASEVGAAPTDHTHKILNTAFRFNNIDIAEDGANLSSTATAHSMSFYRNGLTIPYQMDNPNDGGLIRCRGTSENNVIFEMATWDDSGEGETIQFNYYPYTSQTTPTYSVVVPKKSGTIALTSDVPDISGKLDKSGGTMTGALTFANGTWNVVGDDVAIGDHNVSGSLGVKGLNGTPKITFVNSSGTNLANIGASVSGQIDVSGNLKIADHVVLAYDSTNECLNFNFA